MLVMTLVNVVAPKGAVVKYCLQTADRNLSSLTIIRSLSRKAIEVKMFLVINIVIKPSGGFGVCVVQNEVYLSGSFLGGGMCRPKLR